MQIDGDRLNISLDMTQADIDELKKFVLPRLEYIEEVGFEGGDDEMPLSSALIAFLVSLKKTKSNIATSAQINQNHRPLGQMRHQGEPTSAPPAQKSGACNLLWIPAPMPQHH